MHPMTMSLVSLSSASYFNSGLSSSRAWRCFHVERCDKVYAGMREPIVIAFGGEGGEAEARRQRCGMKQWIWYLWMIKQR